jgi:formylglycine-generating enzyme required for sulfatase activity
VGGKAPNEIGVYDMSGNVWEWNHDWYGTYPSTAESDPVGLPRGSLRVTRGGDMNMNCSVAYLTDVNPSGTYFYIGFRVARSR